jgi:hypothetical protein
MLIADFSLHLLPSTATPHQSPGEGAAMADVRFEFADAQPLAVAKRRAFQAELSRVIPEACGTAWNLVRDAGLANPCRLVAHYLDSEMNLEVGVEVDGPFSNHGELYPSSTPKGMVATATHIGPYDRLGETHEAIRKACEQQGRCFAGPSWEIYGHWTDDPSQLRTEVFYLLGDG